MSDLNHVIINLPCILGGENLITANIVLALFSFNFMLFFFILPLGFNPEGVSLMTNHFIKKLFHSWLMQTYSFSSKVKKKD